MNRDDLTTNELIVLGMIERAANSGKRAPTCAEIMDVLYCNSDSTPPFTVRSLERKGLIKVKRYQRERQITMVATGMKTAPARNKSKHWRDRPKPKNVPTVPIRTIEARQPDLATQIARAATERRVSVQDFIADLVWAGWQAHEIEGVG
jgi:hypothetical protein